MNWLRALLTRRQLDRDLDEEIDQHLAEKVDELVAAGLSRRDAAAAARRAFGNVFLTTENGRNVWRWPSTEEVWADVRYAIRQLRRTPSFTAAAVLTLAVGIGVNTAVFSVVHAIVLAPLPFPDSERLVAVDSLSIRGGAHPEAPSYYSFFEFRRANVMAGMASYRETGATLTGRSVPTALAGQIVSSEFFDVLGVAPVLGRGFLPAEETAGTRVVVLSHGMWTTHFGADPTIVGQSVSLNGGPWTVVGVTPAGFTFPLSSRPLDFWMTLATDASSSTGTPVTEQRGARMLSSIARLRPGMSIDEAKARLDGVAAELAKQAPDSHKNLPATYVTPELEHMVGRMRQPMLMLWGAVTLVLLIACANIANMLMARTADRDRELGIRLAIGGSRARVIRQLLTENLLLALIGGVAGVLAAVAAIGGLVPLVLERLPRGDHIGIDARVLAFTLGLAAITAILVSIPAALSVRRIDVNPARPSAARGGTDGHDGLRSALVVAQLAIGLMLLSGAALLTAAFVHLTTRDLGFRPEGLLAFNVSLPRYSTDAEVAFIDRLLERLRNTPGVSAAAAGTPLPLTGHQMTVGFDIVAQPRPPSERPRSDMAIVTPGYFAAIGAPVIAGRDFTERDDDRQPRVLIVNRAFAQKFFPGQEAVGQRLEPGAGDPKDTRSRIREIVGIVGDAQQGPLDREAEPIYYFPYKQQLPWSPPTLIVRTALAGTGIEGDLRRATGALDPQAPVHDVRTFKQVLSTEVAGPRLITWMMGTFSAIALLLTATGLYGMLSYGVLRRRREIGVRLALGASRGRIVAMILKRALVIAAIGLPLGSVGALAGQALLRTLVFAPDTGGRYGLFLAATLVVTLVTVAAASLPALRAASIDPVGALRNE